MHNLLQNYRYCLPAIFTSAAILLASPAQAQTVHDPLNYTQNTLTAARSLQQINLQLRSLATQIAALQALDKQLASSGQSLSPEIAARLQELQTLIKAGQGIALSQEGSERAFQTVFAAKPASSTEQTMKDAETRFQETLAAFQRASVLQGASADRLPETTAALQSLLARSKAAPGGLEATQAGNELIALHIGQSLQLQTVLAAQGQAQTFERSRALAQEAQARAAFKTFMGTSSAYGDK